MALRRSPHNPSKGNSHGTNEKTSKRVAALAAKAIHDPASVTPKQIQTLAASVLTQTEDQPKPQPKPR